MNSDKGSEWQSTWGRKTVSFACAKPGESTLLAQNISLVPPGKQHWFDIPWIPSRQVHTTPRTNSDQIPARRSPLAARRGAEITGNSGGKPSHRMGSPANFSLIRSRSSDRGQAANYGNRWISQPRPHQCHNGCHFVNCGKDSAAHVLSQGRTHF